MAEPDPLARLRTVYSRLVSDAETMRKAEKLKEKHSWLHLHHAARYIALLGPETAETLFSITEKDVMRSIRVNTLLADTAEVKKRLEDKGFILKPHPYIGYGLIVEKEAYPIGATREYMLGLYTVQGPASMTAVPGLSPESLDTEEPRIADCCAGAGIKTSQLAQHRPDAIIVAVDINRRKLAALKNNMSRLGVYNAAALAVDAIVLPRLGPFDAVLVDAPCSGEGLVPFPKGRWPRSFNDIISRVSLQLRLLRAASDALKEGGVLLYATCTMSVEENEYVTSIVAEEKGLIFEDVPVKGGSPGITEYLGLKINPDAAKCRRFYPHIHRTEGFTICRLRKTAKT